MQIKTEADADKAGKKHLDTEAKIAELKARQDRKIAAVKEEFRGKLATLKKENATLLECLADWFWANATRRDEKTKGQLTLTHVRLSERKSTTYVYPSPLQKVIDKARKLGLNQFVRTKDEVDKERIRAEASEDTLRALGVKTKEETTVYVEQI